MRYFATTKLVLAGAILMVLPFLLFWQIWWPNSEHRLVFAQGDFVEQHFPFRSFTAEEISNGRLPIWDPYTFGGYPAIAESQHATFYPLGLWLAFVPDQSRFLALELEAIFHIGLSAVFTFLLVRQLTKSIGAGVLSGVAFGFSGFLTSYPLLQTPIVEAATWLPAGLWLAELSLTHRTLRFAGISGVLMGFSILAGHPQTSLYSFLIIGTYVVMRSSANWKDVRFSLIVTFVIISIALGLSASQWIPSIQLASMSNRMQLSYNEVSGGFGTNALIGLVRPNTEEWSPLYVGIVPIILALIGLYKRQRQTWYWAIICTFSLLVSLGRHGFVYPFLYSLAPNAALFRGQERAAFLVCFALATLAGYGYKHMTTQNWMPKWLLPIFVIIATVDLFHANYGVILQKPFELGFYPRTPAVNYINDQQGYWRISSEALLPGGGNAGKIFHVRDVTGNGPLSLAHYHQFLGTIPEVRWWQLLNVRYVITQRQINYPGVNLIADLTHPTIYQLDLGSKPVWITHEIEIVPDQDSAFHVTSSIEWIDPYQTAVLEKTPYPKPESAIDSETAFVVKQESHFVEVEVNLSAPGIIILSEIDYPGWEVSANGKTIENLRAFGLLRAVALPSGNSTVLWKYNPRPVQIGLIISGITVCLLVLLLYKTPYIIKQY
jgi:hypothetical protein